MDAEQIETFRAAEKRLWEYYGVTPRERFVDLAKPKVRVRVLEVGQGRPVLCVHGSPSAGSLWIPLVARMPGYRFILLDRPGCGLSNPLDFASGSPRAMLTDMMVSLLDALALPKVDLMVNSFGGYCGLLLALARPERVGRMLQYGLPGFTPVTHLTFFYRMYGVRALSGMMMSFMRLKPEAIKKLYHDRLGHAASVDANRIPEVYWQWGSAWSLSTDTVEHEVGMMPNFIRWNGFKPGILLTESEMRRIATPTAFYWGTADAYGGVELGKQLAQMMPNATLEAVPDAGHMPFLDDPERAARHALAFLSAEPETSTRSITNAQLVAA